MASAQAASAAPVPHGFGPGRVGGFRGSVVIGFPGPFWYGPYYWGYPYPYYGPYYPYYYPYAAYPTAPYPPAPVSWYYCSDPQGYYPYVPSCNKPWLEVPTTTPAPPAESGPKQ